VHRVLPLAIAPAAARDLFDAVPMFSKDTNTQRARWSYRYNDTGARDGNYTLLPEVNSSTVWHTKAGTPVTTYSWTTSSSYPVINANQSRQVLITDNGFGPLKWPGRSIFMHPAPAGLTVLTFRAPRAGTVTVTYSFTDIDPYGGDGIRWYVDRNAGTSGNLASGTLHSTSPGSLATTGLQTVATPVAKGDRINFIVDGNTGYTFDSTSVIARVDYGS
jgi:hypothetical protein